MPLEDIISLLNQLKSRIERHGSLLRQSEALTRYVLIDPLLRGMGWDTEDPEQVRPEWRGAQGFADYALMHSGQPVALIEAKKLGDSLVGGIGQALNYCNTEGINYMVVTDGDRWEMYEVFKQAPLDDRKLLSISLSAQAAYQCAIKAIHLWQPNLGSGAVVVPPTLVIGTQPVSAAGVTPATAPQFRSSQSSSAVTRPSTKTAAGWTLLINVPPPSNAKQPTAIRFPGGEERGIKYWKDVLVETAEWLARKGVLTAAKCPIGRGHKRHVVHSQSVHPNGRGFMAPKTLSSGLFLETNISAKQARADAVFLFQQLGQDPAGIEIRLP